MRLIAAFLAISYLFLTASLYARPHDTSQVWKLLTIADQSYQQINDYKATLTKQEKIRGELEKPQVMDILFRKPFSVRLQWKDSRHKGRIAVYEHGKRGNKILCRQGGALGFVTMMLDPNGEMAMSENSRPITDIGIGRLIELTITMMKHAENSGERFAVVGRDTSGASTDVHVYFSKKFVNKYAASQAKLVFCKKTGLLTGVSLLDSKGHLIARMIYDSLEVNIGLTDKDFRL